MNFAAMYIRIEEYGLTTSRYLSLIFNFSVIIFAVLHEFKKVNFIPVVFSIVPIIFTFTPVNVIDIPILEQSLRLKGISSQNSMIQKNGIIVPNKNLSFDTMHKITSSYFYIKNSNYSKITLLDKSIFEKDFNTVFGFDAKFNDTENKDGKNLTFNYDFIDVENYKKVCYVPYGKIDSISNDIVLNIDGQEFKYNIGEFIRKSLETNSNLENIEFDINNGKFIVAFLNYSIVNSTIINIDSYGEYLLVK